MSGEALVRASVWIALVGYLIGLLGAWSGRDHHRWQRFARRAWTLGCAAYLLHVALAFHLVHGWSHAVALRATARDTAAATGIDTGAGLWLNYLFTALWPLDAGYWWWAGLDRYRRRATWVGGALHAFFLFMAWNATVVFADGAVRWAGIAASLALTAIAGLVRPWRHLRQPTV